MSLALTVHLLEISGFLLSQPGIRAVRPSNEDAGLGIPFDAMTKMLQEDQDKRSSGSLDEACHWTAGIR